MSVLSIWIQQTEEGYVAEIEYDDHESFRFNNDSDIQTVLDKVKQELRDKSVSAEHFGEKDDA